MPTTAVLTDENRKRLLAAAGVSGAILLVGLLLSPDRVWSNLLVGSFFLVTLALGGALYVALTTVSGAGWHVAFRRVPEALAATLPLVGLAILLVLAPKMKAYGWHHHGDHGAGTFWFKELWLTPGFWLLRSVLYIGIWSALGGWLVARSRKQDEHPAGPSAQAGTVRLAAVFLVTYALTFSMASADWIMALEPMWFSTMWGVYNFASMFLATLAAIVIVCVALSGPGRPLHGVFSTEHLHDLGKLMLGFSCFWMYIWFSQYMLIWYSNIPEETSYFITRTQGAWGPIVVAAIVLNWIVPFFWLLPKASKRSRSVMVRVAAVLLLGRWVDLVLMVFPTTLEGTPVVGLWEIAAVVCATSIAICLVDRAFRSAKPIPNNDPYLEESLNYHAG